MNKKEFPEYHCPFFGQGDEINDFGHCWNKNGEPCIQLCNGLLADGETPCAYMSGIEWQKQKAIEAFRQCCNHRTNECDNNCITCGAYEAFVRNINE